MSDKKTDSKNSSQLNGQIILKVLKILRPYIPFMSLSLLASFISVVMQLYSPILSGRAVDLIIKKGNVDIPGISIILIRFIIVICIAIIFQWIMNMINNSVIYRVVKEMRGR